jgi:hypothetical protein
MLVVSCFVITAGLWWSERSIPSLHLMIWAACELPWCAVPVGPAVGSGGMYPQSVSHAMWLGCPVKLLVLDKTSHPCVISNFGHYFRSDYQVEADRFAMPRITAGMAQKLSGGGLGGSSHSLFLGSGLEDQSYRWSPSCQYAIVWSSFRKYSFSRPESSILGVKSRICEKVPKCTTVSLFEGE